MNFQDLLDQLNLSGKKAKVYEAILKSPGSTANEIADLANVSTNKIYQYLTDVENLGLIFTSGVRPRLFWPQDVKDILADKQMKLENRISNLLALKSKAGQINSDLQKEANKESQAEFLGDQVALLRVNAGSEREIFHDLCEQLTLTQDELIFLGDLEEFMIGLKYGVGETVERIMRTKKPRVFQVIGVDYAILEDEESAAILLSREPILRDRQIQYFAGPHKFCIGVVVIDEHLTGILLKNPVLGQFKLAFFIESRELAVEFKKFAYSLKSLLLPSISDCLDLFHRHELVKQ